VRVERWVYGVFTGVVGGGGGGWRMERGRGGKGVDGICCLGGGGKGVRRHFAVAVDMEVICCDGRLVVGLGRSWSTYLRFASEAGAKA